MITILENIARVIIIMSLTGGALALLLIVIKPIIRRRLTKSVQYYLWLVVLAALLTPVSKLIIMPETPSNATIAPFHTVVQKSFAIADAGANTLPDADEGANQTLPALIDSQTAPASTPAVNSTPDAGTAMVAGKKLYSPGSTAITVFIIAYPFLFLGILTDSIMNYTRGR